MQYGSLIGLTNFVPSLMYCTNLTINLGDIGLDMSKLDISLTHQWNQLSRKANPPSSPTAVPSVRCCSRLIVPWAADFPAPSLIKERRDLPSKSSQATRETWCLPVLKGRRPNFDLGRYDSAGAFPLVASYLKPSEIAISRVWHFLRYSRATSS